MGGCQIRRYGLLIMRGIVSPYGSANSLEISCLQLLACKLAVHVLFGLVVVSYDSQGAS